VPTEGGAGQGADVSDENGSSSNSPSKASPASEPTDESILYIARIRSQLSLSIGKFDNLGGCFIPGPPSIMFPDANIRLGSSPQLSPPVLEMHNNCGPLWGRCNFNPIPPPLQPLQGGRRMPRRLATISEMYEDVFGPDDFPSLPLHLPRF
jgi:hypothetical protein